eukprot:g4852.t1
MGSARDKFPWAPLIAISSCLLTNTVAIASLSTYMGVYVQSILGLPSQNSAGYYTSWLQSSFTVGGLLSSYAWGMFADRFGRKPVMVIGTIAACVFSITFGLSTTLSSAMVSRFLFGLGNGMVPNARIMIVELLEPEDAVIGIALLPGSRAVGSIIGPIIGGLLAQPAVMYPSIFSSTGFFARYPFLLPNLAVALVALVALPLVLFTLPETLRLKRGGVDGGKDTAVENLSIDVSGLAEDDALGLEDDSSGSIMLVSQEGVRTSAPRDCFALCPCRDSSGLPLSGAALAAVEHRSTKGSGGSGTGDDAGHEGKGNEKVLEKGKPTAPLLDQRGHRRNYSGEEGGSKGSPRHQRQRRRAVGGSQPSLCGLGGLLSPRRVRVLLLLQCLILVMDVGFFQMYPLWLLATEESGGLQWPVPKIGKVLGWAGVGTMLFQFVGYPALVRTIGIVRLLRGSGVFGALLFLALPDVQRQALSENASYVLGVVFVVLVGCCMSVAETAMNLASANAVPVESRGRIGGIFSMSASLGRVIGPAVLSSLLAWSLHADPPGHGDDHWLVDYHAVFVAEMVLMVVVTALGRKSLTLDAEGSHETSGSGSSGDGGDGGGSGRGGGGGGQASR